jgi:ABC-2 type transport system ATP-binding protein
MVLRAENISKRRGKQWVIRGFSFQFNMSQIYGIAGANGSGKSTLLQLLSSFLEPTHGQCVLSKQKLVVKTEEESAFFSVAAPYLPLIPHFTILEWLEFNAECKGWLGNMSSTDVLDRTELSKHANKPIRALSSGMKQRIQLVTALSSKSKFVFLDEPSSNLDEISKNWLADQLQVFKSQKCIIMASNETSDLALCDQILEVKNYK